MLLWKKKKECKEKKENDKSYNEAMVVYPDSERPNILF